MSVVAARWLLVSSPYLLGGRATSEYGAYVTRSFSVLQYRYVKALDSSICRRKSNQKFLDQMLNLQSLFVGVFLFGRCRVHGVYERVYGSNLNLMLPQVVVVGQLVVHQVLG